MESTLVQNKKDLKYKWSPNREVRMLKYFSSKKSSKTYYFACSNKIWSELDHKCDLYDGYTCKNWNRHRKCVLDVRIGTHLMVSVKSVSVIIMKHTPHLWLISIWAWTALCFLEKFANNCSNLSSFNLN